MPISEVPCFEAWMNLFRFAFSFGHEIQQSFDTIQQQHIESIRADQWFDGVRLIEERVQCGSLPSAAIKQNKSVA